MQLEYLFSRCQYRFLGMSRDCKWSNNISKIIDFDSIVIARTVVYVS